MAKDYLSTYKAWSEHAQEMYNHGTFSKKLTAEPVRDSDEILVMLHPVTSFARFTSPTIETNSYYLIDVQDGEFFKFLIPGDLAGPATILKDIKKQEGYFYFVKPQEFNLDPVRVDVNKAIPHVFNVRFPNGAISPVNASLFISYEVGVKVSYKLEADDNIEQYLKDVLGLVQGKDFISLDKIAMNELEGVKGKFEKVFEEVLNDPSFQGLSEENSPKDLEALSTLIAPKFCELVNKDKHIEFYGAKLVSLSLDNKSKEFMKGALGSVQANNGPAPVQGMPQQGYGPQPRYMNQGYPQNPYVQGMPGPNTMGMPGPHVGGIPGPQVGGIPGPQVGGIIGQNTQGIINPNGPQPGGFGPRGNYYPQPTNVFAPQGGQASPAGAPNNNPFQVFNNPLGFILMGVILGRIIK